MNWSDTTVTVTGAAGFIGSHLSERLVELGATVYALDTFSVGDLDNLTAVEDKIEILDRDIRDVQSDDVAFSDADVIFHLAAIANPRYCEDNFGEAFEVNVQGTKNVLEAAAQCGCDCAVVASSAMVYGEPEYVPIDESHPLNGDDPYSRTKIMGEQVARTYHEQSETDVKISRNFNMFGPRHAKDYLIPTLINQAINEGKIEIWTADSVRDFTFINNTIDALLRIAESNALSGEAVNIGSNIEITSGELAEMMATEFGDVEVLNLEKDTVGSSRLVCDNTKLRETTGWEPSTSFEDGLAGTIEWYVDEWK